MKSNVSRVSEPCCNVSKLCLSYGLQMLAVPFLLRLRSTTVLTLEHGRRTLRIDARAQKNHFARELAYDAIAPKLRPRASA